ncbi:MAG: FhaA domain-containing protein [Dehalococcoidia bacterium]
MTEQGPTIERLLRATARTLSGGALHPLVVLQDVEDACLAGVSEDVVPNLVGLTFSPADHARYEPGFAELRAAIGDMLDRLERSRGYHTIGPREVTFASAASAPEGKVVVAARCSPGKPLAIRTTPPSSTRKIDRVSNIVLMVGGTGVRLTHTPFTIGRAPDNDLVLADLSVSRNHARIMKAGEGFMIEDLGSRNGILVDGKRATRSELGTGRRVKVGDVDVWIESAEG